MSEADILPGTRWAQTIAGELQTSDFGIICITPGNRSAEWVNFEAGALSIAIGETDRKVVPLLIGFDERNAVSSGPLGVFNAVLFTKQDIWKLVGTLNDELNVRVDEQDLLETFELFWPQLEGQVQAIRAASPTPVPDPPSPTEMMKEVLDLLRSMQSDLAARNRPRDPMEPEFATLNAIQAWKSIIDTSITPPDEFVRRYRTTPRGLTKRELLIASMAKEGRSNRQIAADLNLSERTVEGHLYQVFTKLGVTSRRDLPDSALDEKLSDDEDEQ